MELRVDLVTYFDEFQKLGQLINSVCNRIQHAASLERPKPSQYQNCCRMTQLEDKEGGPQTPPRQELAVCFH